MQLKQLWLLLEQEGKEELVDSSCSVILVDRFLGLKDSVKFEFTKCRSMGGSGL